MTPKFKVGDRIRYVGCDPYPPYGAEAVVTEALYDVEGHSRSYVRIKWDRTHTAHGRNDGGYYEKDFELVAAAKLPKVKKESHATQAYKGNGKHEWENVTADTARLRVPGGYLYRDIGWLCMAFVPMPSVVKHKV